MATIPRGLLLALAIAASAWFVLGVRQARDTARATALVTGAEPLSPARARRARWLLQSAGTLNPDLTVDLLRGRLALDQHDSATAQRLFRSVARREPQNVDAWAELALAASQTGDRRTLTRAVRMVAELYPKPK